jgi:hypothetical protein
MSASVFLNPTFHPVDGRKKHNSTAHTHQGMRVQKDYDQHPLTVAQKIYIDNFFGRINHKGLFTQTCSLAQKVHIKPPGRIQYRQKKALFSFYAKNFDQLFPDFNSGPEEPFIDDTPISDFFTEISPEMEQHFHSRWFSLF